MYHLALSGDVVLTTIGVVGAAAIAAIATVITSLINTRRAKAIAADTKAIATEMQPNGGSTVRDAIDLINRRLMTHDEHFAVIDRKQDRTVEALERIEKRQRGEEDPT